MSKIRRTAGSTTAIALLVALTHSIALASAPPGPYFNGFEKNTYGWFDISNGGDGKITRVHSGYSNGGGYADGINSASGHWHARLMGQPPCVQSQSGLCFGPYTNWGGYSSTFPPGGYLTQLDIYLDVNWAATHNDFRFDWISAINDKTGNFRRDWVFNAGTELPGDFVPGFWVNASTNSTRSGAFPENPCPNPPDPISNPPVGCRTPVKITTSGWYTFRHTFRSGFFVGCPDTACLIVDFDIFNQSTGALVAHWTIHSDQDPMSVVGGNRYGWFSTEEIPDLAIDNSLRTGLCHSADGDGDAEGSDSRKGHFHFHKNSCDNRSEDVEEDDDDSGAHFQSTAISSANFVPGEDNETATIVGTGLHNGVPVGFTMVTVDNQGLAPSVYTLVLTDGYAITGNVISGGIALQ